MGTRGGFSLVECLLVVALLAVLAGLAAPSLRGLLLDARMTMAVNAAVHAVHAARVLARTGLGDAVLCRSIDAARCAAAGDWSVGWIVFVNGDGDEPPQVDAGERVALVQPAGTGLTVASNRAAYVLRPWGLRATNGTLVFCDARGAAAARAVIIGPTGRPRVSRRRAGGAALACPA